ncbi:hypothetical protein [Escherichia phage pEC-M719-6WT.1]|uniref:Uncharacterized protein n=1 Tax=Escherichia phage pEC-M719-6WT.1 TaxID=3056220 RepID=A0AA51YF98_9CAUD|nr:hypothetical protein [Escherichia phage pEC-M719-6WT.1]
MLWKHEIQTTSLHGDPLRSSKQSANYLAAKVGVEPTYYRR